jgi:hypothetical protein
MRLRNRLLKVALPVAALGLWSSTTVFSQDKGGSTNKSAAGQPKTVVGCLTGYDGHYTLGASNDTLYLLDGDSAAFKKLNARMVKVTGLVSEPSRSTSEHNVLSQQPPTLTVQTLKKVADGCN